MKKALFLAMGLSSMITFAQDYKGRVGINTDQPKATLDIQPNATNLAGTTNEGIIAPKLTKKRVADITYSSPQDIKNAEGTLVYITETDYTQENSTNPTEKDKRVAKIDEKGYYYYNGAEWVKSGNNAEWVYDDTTKRINLKRSYDNNNFKNMVFYDPNGGLRNIDFGINREIISGKYNFEYNTKGTFNFFAPYNAIIKQASNLGVGNTLDRFLNYNATVLDNITPNASYTGIGHSYTEKGNEVVDLKQIRGIILSHYFRNGSKIGDIIGVGSHINLLNESSVEGGEVKGYRSYIEYTSPKSPKKIISNFSDLNMRGKGSSESVIGDMKYLTFKDNNTGNIKDVVADYTHFTFSENSNPNIENIYHYRGTYFTDDTITSLPNIKNAYGLYLGSINFASEKNYAIYTNAGKVRFGDNVGIGVDAPTQKLEVAGKIKASNVIFTGIPTYADDVTAGTGGLVAGEMYKTSTGELRIKL